MSYATYFRSSSYNTYDFCPMQFFINYNLGIPGANWKASTKGTVIHKVMEVIAGLKLFEQENPDKRKLVLPDENIGEVKVWKKDFRTEEFTYNLLKDCYNYYTEKCENNYNDKDWKFCEKWTEEALTFDDGRFDPRNQNILQPEQHFDITFEEDWAKYNYQMPDGEWVEGYLSIKGTIDLLTIEDKDTIETIDYKTGQCKNFATGQRKDYDYFTKDPQLLLYYYAIKRLYPEFKNVLMTIYYVRDGGPFTMCYDEEDEEYFKEKLRERFKEVLADNNPKCIKYDRTLNAEGKEKRSACFMCRYKKDNWPGTNTSICDYVETSIKHLGMDETIKGCQEKDFSIDYYHAPGS